jgi:aryl-alcohol dehydrogenase-like predicted oxidoreductase
LLTGKYIDADPASDTRLGLDNMSWLKERSLDDASKLEKVKSLKKLADQLGISLTHLSLCWCLKNPNISTVILGASKVEQLADNLNSLQHLEKLTPDAIQAIEDILQNKPVIPVF